MAYTTNDYQPTELLFATFNQDSTSLAVGSQHGYKLYSLDSVDKLEMNYSDDGMKDVYLIERHFSSCLIAVVSLNSPRKLKLRHLKKNVDICEHTFSNSILAVKFNRSRIVVLLENNIHIYEMNRMKVLHTIRDTPSNVKGICALSANSDRSFGLLAYPGSQHIGEIQIFDVIHLKAVTTIQAHNNPLAAMAFNKDATLIATASDKGTVIRVFSVHDGKKVYEFRRGVKRCVAISSLAFSSDSTFLAASSNTETVHIFKLEDVSDLHSVPNMKEYQSDQMKSTKSESSWMDYFSKVIATSSSYLPTQFSDILRQDRAFATVKLPSACKQNICTLAVIQKLLRVVIASLDGYMYIYNLDTDDGGECTLLRQHRLDINPAFMTPSSIAIPTYADAAKVKTMDGNRLKARTGSTGSSASCSSDSIQSNTPHSDSSPISGHYSGSPKRLDLLQLPIDEFDNLDHLPLNDVEEFPPVRVCAK